MQKELNIIKEEIANSVKLIHYDPKKTAVFETDASIKGLGAVLKWKARALPQQSTNTSLLKLTILTSN